MSIVETVTVFVGVPALVIAVVAGLVYLSGTRSGRRYRPGRPFEFTPVWFLASGEGAATGGPGTGPERSTVDASGPTSSTNVSTNVKGGAHGTW